jgi:hypothetical protein
VDLDNQPRVGSARVTGLLVRSRRRGLRLPHITVAAEDREDLGLARTCRNDGDGQKTVCSGGGG